MILISFGVMKSGSTLAFEMAKAVLELNGWPQDRLDDHLVVEGHKINFVRDWTDASLAQLLDATRDRKIAIKTHGSPSEMASAAVLDAIDAGDVKIHVVYRDPRDMVLSMLDHGVRARAEEQPAAFFEIKTLDDAIERVGGQLRRLRAWGAFPSLRLQYERFAFEPSGPEAIAADLGLEADPERVRAIAAEQFTQKYVGEAGRYRSDLWPEEVERVERAFPLFLELVRGNDLGWFGAPA